MLNGLFNRLQQNPEQEQSEYIQYAQEVESTLRLLEAQLHESDDSEEIIQNVMKTAEVRTKSWTKKRNDSLAKGDFGRLGYHLYRWRL